jgi:2-hydroxychromene-2-carboxylate isomerase
MAAPIDFYFDFSSPYGYFASTRIDALAARHGRQVLWHPVLLGAVFKAVGGGPLLSLPMKGPYSQHDVPRTARFHNIPYRHPSVFPLATQTAARAMLWIQDAHGHDKAVEFAKGVYKAYFVEDVHIGEAANLAPVAERIGIDAVAMGEGIASQQIKDRLKADVGLAMARGVFGSPFVMVDGEGFWGFDRFDQVVATLERGRI